MNITTIHYSFLYTEYIYIQMLEEKALIMMVGLGMWINYGFQQDLQNNIFALEQQESGMKGVINYNHWLTTARAFWVAQFLVLAVLIVSIYTRRDAFGKNAIIGSSGLS